MTTTRNDFWHISLWSFQKTGVLIEQAGVVLKLHIAATTPGLITDTKESDFKWLVAAIFAA